MAARGRGSAGSSSRAPSVAGTALLCVAVAVLLLAATPAAVAGTTYLVGDAAGWTLKVDYGRWVAGKTFHAGDILVFKYNTTWHDVAWVSKGGYRNCIVSPKGRAPVYHTGYDAVTLPRGTHYFICAMPGHCSAGMKLAVTVY
ncbi:Chemocyanin [Zea mays]|uniref:Plantacyanin n=2 Tax=Zea mays TaxID=4577 RepID=K7W7V8_MAIZE|nr:basic blue protein [Zea mays]AQL02971.1 Basic blue protein [Zea mays]PWZ05319.1 Chemocyanin [Zea mays]|eukprot:XP_008659439.1 basic blue protein [Zea mays]